MPVLFLDTPDTGGNVTRSLVKDIVRDVTNRLKIDTTKLTYLGDISQSLSTGSTIGSTDDVSFGGNSLLTLQVTEDIDEDGVYTSSRAHEEHLDVFTDRKLGLRVKPLYFDYRATLEFTYRADSLSSASAWRSTMRAMLEGDWMTAAHHPEYQYPFDVKALEVITHVHSLREQVSGYGQTLVEYLRACCSPRVMVVSNLAGNNSTFMIQEHQARVIGWYEHDIPPKESKTGDGSTWDVTFSYIVKYQKPSGFKVTYPLIVHGQMLKPRYIPSMDYNERNRKDHTVLSRDYDRLKVLSEPHRIGFSRSPVFDDWEEPMPKRVVSKLLQFLIRVDVSLPGEVLDLKDLGEFTLKPALLTYLNELGNNVFSYGAGNIYIGLYRNNNPVDFTTLNIVDGVVSTTESMDIRDTFHLCIGIIDDLTTVSDDGITLLCKNPQAVNMIIKSLEPAFNIEELIPTIVNDRVSEYEFRLAMEYIHGTASAYRARGIVDRVRSGYCTINTGVNYNA